MIPSEEKEGCHYLAVKKTICITKRNNIYNIMVTLLLELSSFS